LLTKKPEQHLVRAYRMLMQMSVLLYSVHPEMRIFR